MMDTQACEVRVSGTITPFTYKEYELLKLLLENKNRVFTRDDLLRIVWSYDFVGDDRVVNNPVSYTHLDVYKRQMYELKKIFRSYERNGQQIY